MVDTGYLETLKPKEKVFKGVLTGLLVSLGLSVAYVYGGGMSLLGNAEFTTINNYAFVIAFAVGSLVSVMYWLYFRDISEALAIEFTIVWSLWFGLQDLIVYALLPGRSVPGELPWLEGTPVEFVAGLFGFSGVSRTSLYVSVLVSGLVLLFLVKTLDDLEKSYLGLNL